MFDASAVQSSSRARFLQPRAWIGIGILVAILLWKIAPVMTAYAHQTKGYDYLNQALALLGERHSGPDYCIVGGVKEGDSKNLVAQATQSLEAAHAEMPTNPHTLLLLGRAYCLSGNFEAAIEAYEKYTHLRPKNPLGHLELGGAYEAFCAVGEESENLDVWMEALACAIPNLQLKILSTWQAGGITEQDFLNAGEEARKAGNFDEALKWYGQAVVLSPNSAEPWNRTGLVYQDLGEWDKAVQAFRTAWELNPETNTNHLAAALSQQGDFQSAEEVLRLALQTFPSSFNRLIWWQGLGENLTKQERFEEAINVYQEAIGEFSKAHTLHIGLGWAHYENGDGVEAALAEFNLASSLNEQLGDGYLAAAQLLVQEKRYTEADLWFQKALEKEPGRRGWYIARGNAARLGNDLTLAIQTYKELIQFDPNYSPAYYEIAWAYHLLDQTNQAIEAMDKAIELSVTPKPEYYVRLGQIYENSGSLDRALSFYHQAVHLDPNNLTAAQGIERLSRDIP